MPRSPFQGTWQDGVRPTVVTAPDALVMINGESEILGCGNCRRKFDINKYITSIQVDLSVDSAPGSASINLSIPRHTVDEFFFEGEPLVTPMMEIEIYAKGYFLVEGVPQYYPIFWGLVTEVTDSYSGGEHTVAISCADILKWWELCKMNINPAFTQASGQLGKNYVHGTLFNANVYDVVWTLAQQSFGDIVQATGSLVSTFREQTRKQTFDRAKGGIIRYWTERFSQMRGNLLLYGVKGAAVRGDLLYATQTTPQGVSQKWASQAVRQANGGESSSSQLYFDPDTVIPFRSNIGDAGQPNLWQSEYQSKLELANACKEAVGFEFFMDVTGDIVFKPPFYNLDVISNKPVSWVQDIDIIDWNFSNSEAEVITHLQMQGSAEGGPMDHGVTADYNTPYQQVIDYHLLREYGWRTQTYNAEYLSNPQAMFYMGLDMLDRFNARRHRSTMTVPFRPELRLGFPVYVAPKDQIWYLTGLSHSITMGGRAQTQMTLTAKRQKFIAPRGIGSLELVSMNKKTTSTTSTNAETSKPLQEGRFSAAQLSNASFKMKIGAAAQIPPTGNSTSSLDDDPYAPLILRHPKTGRVVGYPNVVLAYTKSFDPENIDALLEAAGQKTGTDRGTARKLRKKENSSAREQNALIQKDAFTQTTEKDLRDRHMVNRYMYGMTSAGVYTYVHDKGRNGVGIVQELVQLPAANIQLALGGEEAKEESVLGKSAAIRPVSDERGFELIGHYRYGRGVSLRDGSLVLTDTSTNSKAAVATQLAMSGDLYATLRAQSSGLTALSDAYTNPAVAVSTLGPEDTQTAATLNPETGAAEFSTVADNFVDTAPLGSPANAGLPTNVEASQLSNALTLAELRPADEMTPSPDCVCLSGRGDLAFINVGYQVGFLKRAGTDSSNLETAPGGTGAFGEGIAENQRVEAIDAALVEVQAEYAAILEDPLYAEQSSTGEAIRAEAASLEAQIAALRVQRTEAEAALTQVTSAGAVLDDNGSALRPVMGGGIPVPKHQSTLSRVEQFLASLYSTLDDTHQEHEKTLRGEHLPTLSREQIITGTAPTEEDRYGQFKPPYSAINRARGGDLDALARQGSTAINDMAHSWAEFGENLQNKSRSAELQANITRLEGKISDLNAEEERLERAKAAGNTIISPDGSIQERLDSLRSERTKARQDLAKSKADLQLIRNKEGQT